MSNKVDVVQSKSDLPMVRASVMQPIIHRFARTGADTDTLLARFDLDQGMVSDPTVYVRNDVVYQIFEAVVQIVDDKNFCARVGDSIDHTTFTPFGAILKEANTIGDFIFRFTQLVARHSTSVSQRLIVEDNWAYFSAKRLFEPKANPAQSDGFMVGIWISFLHGCMDFRWDPSMIIVRVCDPRVLPAQFHGLSPIRSNNKGFSIRFPAVWLSHPIDGELAFQESTSKETNLELLAPSSFVDAVSSILSKHISDRNLNVDKAAALCGYSKPALTRRPARLDTSIFEMLTHLRMADAKDKLTNTFLSVSAIAESQGYSDATAFSRAFKKLNSVSPRDYRQKYKVGQKNRRES